MTTPYWPEVLISLRQIIRATDLQSKRVMKACGLTIPQVMVLKAIETLGDVTVKRISDHVSLSQATVTIILNRMEDKGFIERVRSAKDRRIVNARMTDSGQTMLNSAPPLLHEEFIRQFEALPKAQMQTILDSLQQVATMMNAEELDVAPLLDIQATTPEVAKEQASALLKNH
jgi:DNA-binding MarR family transcriptional regulator